VSFTSGQLPFNPSSDKAIEVGFATNIQALADFLAQ
jgi:enamine deaminase RidA (YjgF/YER057c/UK114 family)